MPSRLIRDIPIYNSRKPEVNREMKCKNCGFEFNGNFCNNCGQDAKVGKLDRHFILHELQHGILNVDSGIFFTLGKLLISPGKFLKNYIRGERGRHLKPLSFLIIISGFYAYASHYSKEANFINYKSPNHNINIAVSILNQWANEHYLIVLLATLPLTSLIYFLTFKFYRITYLEHLVINSYLSGVRIIARLALIPFLYFVNDRSIAGLEFAADLSIPALFCVWAYTVYVGPGKTLSHFCRSLLAYLITVIVNIGLIGGSLYMLSQVFPLK